MAVTDVSNLKKKRQQKKFLRFLKKLVIFLIAAALVLAVILTKDMWYPKLNGILNRIPVTDNSSELAQGYFPLSIEGGASYQLETTDNAIAVLDDAHFVTYDLNGKKIFTAQHALAKPVLTVSGKKSLIYDLGGTTFTLMSKYKQIYSKTTDSAILLARLSSNDYAAVVTKSDKFLSMLMVYDKDGQNIFNYGSVERIIDVTFTADSSGCVITVLDSADGVIVSRMLYYRFDGIDEDALGNPIPVWQTDNIETLALSVRLFGEDKIILLGDTLCAYFALDGKPLNSYKYENELSGYDCDGSIAALAFRNTELRSSEIVIIDSTAETTVKKSLDETVENIQTANGEVYLHNRGGITAYTPLGENNASVGLDSDYEDFRRIGSYIFLLGYDSINRIDFQA